MTMQLEFTPEILEELNYERYHHPLPLVQRRMEALWLKSHGLPHGKRSNNGVVDEAEQELFAANARPCRHAGTDY